MADLDRNTGLPVRATNPYQDQSFTQNALQTTGPRRDQVTTSGIERTNQAVSSASSALNTTPGALAALDQVIGQLLGTPGRPAATADTLEIDFPLLVPKRYGGRAAGDRDPGHKGTILYHDPKTGKTFREEEGKAENERRMAQRKIALKQGAVAATPGGTPEMQEQMAARKEEISRNRALQGSYSKANAFSDAQALTDKAIADALERTLPQITSAIEGSGTSKGSMAALLTQRAAEKAGVEGAALGAQTAVAYGGINANLANTLEALTRSDPNSPTALLLQAIIGSKGLVSDQNQTQNTSGVSQKTGTQDQQIGVQQTFNDTLKNIIQPLADMAAFNNPGRNSTPENRPKSSGTIARNPGTSSGGGNIITAADINVYGQDDSYGDLYSEEY